MCNSASSPLSPHIPSCIFLSPGLGSRSLEVGDASFYSARFTAAARLEQRDVQGIGVWVPFHPWDVCFALTPIHGQLPSLTSLPTDLQQLQAQHKVERGSKQPSKVIA